MLYGGWCSWSQRPNDHPLPAGFFGAGEDDHQFLSLRHQPFPIRNTATHPKQRKCKPAAEPWAGLRSGAGGLLLCMTWGGDMARAFQAQMAGAAGVLVPRPPPVQVPPPLWHIGELVPMALCDIHFAGCSEHLPAWGLRDDRTPWAEVAFWIPPPPTQGDARGSADARSSADACLS